MNSARYKNTQDFYYEALALASDIRKVFRNEYNVDCIRTFSHPLINGRRMKFWLVKDSTRCIAAANQLVNKYDAELQKMGWSLGFQVISNNHYGTSITFKVTKM